MNTTTVQSPSASKRVLVETVILMLITVSSVFVPNVFMKYLLEAPAFIYLMIEMFVRHRSPRDIGFKIKNTPGDLVKYFPLVFLDVIVLQIAPLLIGKFLLPSYIDHLRIRMPAVIQTFTMKSEIVFIVTILITAIICLYEELIYRGFFLERLSWFTKPFVAISLSVIIFTCMHFTPGNPWTVLFDLSFVMIDGTIFSIIYYKTKNICASFTVHILANIFGIIMFRLIF